MKYKTFARLRTGVVALVAAGVVFVGCRAATAPQATPSEPTTVAQGNDPTFETVTAPPSQVDVTPKTNKSSKPSKSSKVAKPSAPQQEATAGSEPMTEWQQEVIKMQKQPLTNGELKSGSYKWVVNGGGMRAEFRSDADKGAKGWNRVKVDLNQNKKFEERWDFKDNGSIKRRVAPNDDENYSEEWTLKGQTWVRRK